MDIIYQMDWAPELADPAGCRSEKKPRIGGKTMVIDKGMGMRAYEDFLETSGEYVDIIKLGFGTSALYPIRMLSRKIGLAKEHGITIMPGGTFLEVAFSRGLLDSFFQSVRHLGFNGLEVSDGTIELAQSDRAELIQRGLQMGMEVFTEFGKKLRGSTIAVDELVETIHADTQNGASLVIVEGRESGRNVGIYDEAGECRDDMLHDLLRRLPTPELLMWETPLKDQQVHLLRMLGPDIHLGNIAPQDVYALEALRRGLRSDTFRMPFAPGSSYY